MCPGAGTSILSCSGLDGNIGSPWVLSLAGLDRRHGLPCRSSLPPKDLGLISLRDHVGHFLTVTLSLF